MSGLSINGKHIAVQGIKQVDPNISIQEASEKTNKNGIDEVYFNVDGKNFVAYGDKLSLNSLKKGDMPTLSLDGKAGSLVTFEDEANSVMGGLGMGALGGLKTTRDVVTSAVGTSVRSSGVTSVVAVGGALGLTGYAVVKGVSMSSGGSPILNILDDVLVKGSLKAAKGVAIAAAAGLVIAVGTSAVVGAAESLSTEKNYSSIASITKEGNYKENPTAPATTPAPSQQAVEEAPISIKPVANPTTRPTGPSSNKPSKPKVPGVVLPPGISIGMARPAN